MRIQTVIRSCKSFYSNLDPNEQGAAWGVAGIGIGMLLVMLGLSISRYFGFLNGFVGS